MNTALLKELEFELAYLSCLTKEGIKPLSRWEKDFDRTTEEVLQGLGLKTRAVERSVQSGKRLRELLFSTSEQHLDTYATSFAGTPVNRSRENVRLEGLLFGYPSCCVESYVAKGYVRNSLRRRDQRILFHWACPQCAVTPLLLPHYRRIHRACRLARHGRAWASMGNFHDRAVSPCLRRALAVAAALAALGMAPAATLPAAPAADPLDPHAVAFPPADDPDRDFLATSEELLLGMDPAIFDENGNAIPDGVDVAHALSAAIDALSTTPSATQPYLIHHMAFGLENCQVCGAVTNMGSLEIINPLENQSVAMPYVAKHFLEHGGFTYVGTNLSGILHSGRLNPALLQTVLTSAGLAHFIAEPADTDADNDALRDWEEPAFLTDPANRDSDGDQLLDGIDAMRDLRAQLDTLPRASSPETGPKDRPFVVEHPMDGIETCPRCGERVVMGIWDVINPVIHASICIPSMALHYMEHGGPSWQGGQLLGGEGRVNPRQLRAVLTGEGDGHWLDVPSDTDGDLLADDEETELGKNPRIPDEDGNRVLDGVDLAKSVAAEIAALPTGPVTAVYRLDFLLRGLERCDICGTNVNMGHLTVCNPIAGLYAHVPYITLHYLGHGSFSYAGDVHGAGRADIKLLLDALHSVGPSHLLPVSGDTDADGLKDSEERHFQLNETRPDTDGDGVPDGFQLAREMWQAVKALPRTNNPSCYAVEHPQRGLAPCSVCGTQVNMGGLDVVNPREQLTVTLPYLALHFLRHGSFAWTPEDRVNPCRLDIALHGDGSSHLVVWPGDTDRDGLLDAEEPHFGTRPETADSNGDGVLDGVELARRLHQRIQTLPIAPHASGKYRVPFEANCFAPCAACGENINCGHEVITNAWAELSVQVSFMNLHYLEHGGLAASPTERVDPILLDTILQPVVTIKAREGGITLRWLGKARRTYQIFTSADIAGPWTPGPTFSADGTELVFTDTETAGRPRQFYQVRMW
jgi:hypothetical protein